MRKIFIGLKITLRRSEAIMLFYKSESLRYPWNSGAVPFTCLTSRGSKTEGVPAKHAIASAAAVNPSLLFFVPAGPACYF
jgi:hypothetical protein